MNRFFSYVCKLNPQQTTWTPVNLRNTSHISSSIVQSPAVIGCSLVENFLQVERRISFTYSEIQWLFFCRFCGSVLHGYSLSSSDVPLARGLWYCSEVLRLLGAFTKLRKATISWVMSVRPSAFPPAWKNSAPTGRIFMKFAIGIYSNICRGNSKFH